ncbi:unnamed protein product, partial [Owenia fusiformis]
MDHTSVEHDIESSNDALAIKKEIEESFAEGNIAINDATWPFKIKYDDVKQEANTDDYNESDVKEEANTDDYNESDVKPELDYSCDNIQENDIKNNDLNIDSDSNV